MTLPTSQIFPENPDQLPPARRRRARQLLAPLDIDERAAFLDELAHRASPSFDFFLFSLIGGLVFTLGLLLDAPGVLVLAALLSPLMAPAVGVSLGIVTGSIAFFLRSLSGLLIGSLLTFFTGFLGGLLGNYLNQSLTTLELSQAYYHAQLSWPNILALGLGSGFTVAMLANENRNAAIPSIVFAYQLYLPLTIAGFGLGGGFVHLWPDGLVVFAIHLACSALVGVLVFAILGYRPLTLFGYTVSAFAVLMGVIILIGLGGAGAVFGGRVALPTLIPSATPSITPSITFSPTLVPPTDTPTTTLTPTISPTITKTPRPSPTPRYALVAAPGSDGAVLRSEPGGEILKSYVNGTLLMLSSTIEEVDGVSWVRVTAPDNVEGWIMQTLVATATPVPP